LNCPDCGGDKFVHVYSKEEIINILAKSKLNPINQIYYELQLRSLFKCEKCSYTKNLNAADIHKLFFKKKLSFFDIRAKVKRFYNNLIGGEN